MSAAILKDEVRAFSIDNRLLSQQFKAWFDEQRRAACNRHLHFSFHQFHVSEKFSEKLLRNKRVSRLGLLPRAGNSFAVLPCKHMTAAEATSKVFS